MQRIVRKEEFDTVMYEDKYYPHLAVKLGDPVDNFADAVEKGYVRLAEDGAYDFFKIEKYYRVQIVDAKENDDS